MTRNVLDPRLAISIGQLQAMENLVASWRAMRAIWEPMTLDMAEAFNETDAAAKEAEEACLEVRGMGS